MAKQPFQKVWRSYSDQVAKLRSRGLTVDDSHAAEDFLSHLNYYRFSGYCLAFEVQRHQFHPGVTFDDVTRAYQFDLALRDLLTEALEVIEVDLRATVAYHFGRQYGPFGHIEPRIFFSRFDHFGWLKKIRDEAERSQEEFVQHFRDTYLEYPNLPIWMVTEVMSFGCLSKMIGGMIKADQKRISVRYGLQPLVFHKLIHHLVYVRNLCAHHSRVWDRIWSIKPELPAGQNWMPPLLPGNQRLFSTLLLIRKLLTGISAVKEFSGNWHTRMTQHLSQPPATPDPLRLMGLTPNWLAHPLWA